MQKCNVACCLVWVCNLVTRIEEHRLREFENRALRKMSGPKGDEVTGNWRAL